MNSGSRVSICCLKNVSNWLSYNFFCFRHLVLSSPYGKRKAIWKITMRIFCNAHWCIKKRKNNWQTLNKNISISFNQNYTWAKNKTNKTYLKPGEHLCRTYGNTGQLFRPYQISSAVYTVISTTRERTNDHRLQSRNSITEPSVHIVPKWRQFN